VKSPALIVHVASAVFYHTGFRKSYLFYHINNDIREILLHPARFKPLKKHISAGDLAGQSRLMSRD
jgi:hypothetical protein